jgi:SRSO17 transposase
MSCHVVIMSSVFAEIGRSRWGVEETFQFTKNETGLDHYQVRTYAAWYRHITNEFHWSH